MSLRRRISLSEEAEGDLDDILQYTLETWGPRQVGLYARRLEKGLEALAGQPRIGKGRNDLYPGCRCHQIEEHIVYYSADEDVVSVARILHKRMHVRLYL